MARPRRRRPPDWLVYGGAVLALTALAIGEQERADAPPAPPPMQGLDPALAPGAAFKAVEVKRAPASGVAAVAGTAFSVSDAGVWVTARHVVSGCSRTAVMVSQGRGVAARVVADRSSDLAVLITQGGAPPLPLAPYRALLKGQRGYQPGFPQGTAGETATRYLGFDVLRPPGRGARPQTVTAWAEVGRTDGLSGSLAGLSGAPVLDWRGQVVGVILAESPRRGRLYSATGEALRAALAAAGQAPSGFARGETITTENYGRAADDLRRDLRVAQVVCLE